jgi:heat shock protein HslJ
MQFELAYWEHIDRFRRSSIVILTGEKSMITKQHLALLLVAVTLILAACTGTGSPQTDGQASGNGSCNSLGGEYTLRGDKLTFKALMSTMMACFPEEIMQQEQAYLASLAATASYQVQEDRLTLFDADGNVLAEFVPVVQ